MRLDSLPTIAVCLNLLLERSANQTFLAKWTDGKWYRAFAVEMCYDGYITLEFLDFGCVNIVSIKSIRRIPQSLMFPCLTLTASFTDSGNAAIAGRVFRKILRFLFRFVSISVVSDEVGEELRDKLGVLSCVVFDEVTNDGSAVKLPQRAYAEAEPNEIHSPTSQPKVNTSS